MAVLTAAQITAWLNDPLAIRGVLVEANVRAGTDTADITRYFSNFNYTTSPTDTPANISYDAILSGSFNYTEKLDWTGGYSSSLSVGDLELQNKNGEYDSYLNDNWGTKPIVILLGDVRWPRNSFFPIFTGTISDIDSRSRYTLNLKLRDKLSRLNTPISEIKYADVQPYPDSSNVQPWHDPTDNLNTVPDILLPVTFGEVFNITPILIDAGNLVYIVNFGPFQGIVEIRDDGLPLPITAYTVNYAKGTFKMLYKPAGILTASIQGDNVSQTWDAFAPGVTYRQTIGSIIRRLATGYGKTVVNPLTGAPTLTPSTDRFNDSIDIDQANFAAFETSNTQPVGVYTQSRENLLTICQQLAGSVGAQLAMSRLGKLRLLKLIAPTTGSTFSIDDSHIIAKSLAISGRTDIVGSVNLGFTRSYTVEPNLVTGIPYDHKQMFALEYSTVIKSDGPTIAKYNITAYPAEQDTLLITQPAAYAEATRRLNLYKVPHTIYKFVGLAPLLDLQLGDIVTLTHDRFGLQAGKLGTVVSLTPDWLTAKVTVEVFI